jgi:hypothetical protein
MGKRLRHRQILIRTVPSSLRSYQVLFSSYFTGGKFNRTAELSFRKAAYTKHDVTRSVQFVDFITWSRNDCSLTVSRLHTTYPTELLGF